MPQTLINPTERPIDSFWDESQDISFYRSVLSGLSSGMSRAMLMLEKTDDRIYRALRPETEEFFAPYMDVNEVPEWRLPFKDWRIALDDVAEDVFTDEQIRNVEQHPFIPREASLDAFAASATRSKLALGQLVGQYLPMIGTAAGVGKIGVLTLGYLMNAGDNISMLLAEDKYSEDEILLRAGVAAVPQAGLDALGAMVPFLHGSKGVQFQKFFHRRTGKSVLADALAEGGTEGMQNVIQLIALNEDPASVDQFLERWQNGGMENAMQGFVFGAVGAKMVSLSGHAGGVFKDRSKHLQQRVKARLRHRMRMRQQNQDFVESVEIDPEIERTSPDLTEKQTTEFAKTEVLERELVPEITKDFLSYKRKVESAKSVDDVLAVLKENVPPNIETSYEAGKQAFNHGMNSVEQFFADRLQNGLSVTEDLPYQSVNEAKAFSDGITGKPLSENIVLDEQAAIERRIQEKIKNPLFRVKIDIDEFSKQAVSDIKEGKPLENLKLDFNKKYWGTPDSIKILSESLSREFRKQGVYHPQILKKQSWDKLKRNSLSFRKKYLKQFETETGLDVEALSHDMQTTAMSMLDVESRVHAYRVIDSLFTNEILKVITQHEKELNKGVALDVRRIRAMQWINTKSVFQPSLKIIQTSVARTLNQFKIPISGRGRFDLADKNLEVPGLAEARADLLEILGGRETIDKFLLKWKKETNQKKRNQMLRDRRRNKALGTAILTYQQANLLMDPIMRAIDFFGPAILLALDRAELTLAFITSPLYAGANNIFGKDYHYITKREIASVFYSDYINFILKPLAQIRQLPKFIQREIKTSSLEELKKSQPREIVNRLERLGVLKARDEVVSGLSKENIQETFLGTPINRLGDILDTFRVHRAGNFIIQEVLNKPIPQFSMRDALWYMVDQAGATVELFGFGVMKVMDPLFERLAVNAEISRVVMREGMSRPELRKDAASMSEFIAKTEAKMHQYMHGELNFTSAEELDFFDSLRDIAIGKAQAVTAKGPINRGYETDFGVKFGLSHPTHFILNTAESARKWINAHPLFKSTSFQFITTTMHLIRRSVQLNPFVIALHDRWQSRFMGRMGVYEQQRALAEMMLGSLLMYVFYALWQDKKLQGAFDPKQRLAKNSARLMENSTGLPFVDSDMRYDLERFPPISNIAKFTSSTYDIIDLIGAGAEADQLFTMTYFGVMNYAVNQPFTEGLWTLVQATMDPSFYYMNKFATDYAATFIPLGGLKRGFTDHPLFDDDPVIRETVTFRDKLKRNLIGLDEEDRNPRVDILSEPFLRDDPENPFDIVADLLKIRRASVSDDPVLREIARLGISMKRLERRIDGVELEEKEIRLVHEFIRDRYPLRRILESIIASDTYNSPLYSDALRAEMIRSEILEARAAARDVLSYKLSRVYDEIRKNEKEALIEMFTPSNINPKEVRKDLKELMRINPE